MERRKVALVGTAMGPAAPTDSDVFKRCPNLLSHCTVQVYDDGSSRVPGWFTIQAKAGQWEVTVKDPDSAAKLRTRAETIDDALCLMELLLADPLAQWEIDPWLKQQKPKKKK